jgi:hypothetical protein
VKTQIYEENTSLFDIFALRQFDTKFQGAMEIHLKPQWQTANVSSFHPVLLISANLKECFIVAPLQYEKYLTFERSLFQH